MQKSPRQNAARFVLSRDKARAHPPLDFAARRPAARAVHPLIRPATAADVPQILAFIRALADYEKLSADVTADEAQLRATLFPEDGAPVARCVLAFAGEAPAGFALYFFNYSTFLAKPGLYLEDLFVKPEFRSQGIGKALLLHLAQLANARGCGRMEWSVLDWNAPAIAFYESLGARRMTEWQICRLTGPALARHA
jgi:GNAT superfamily N-acetyltransferase